MMSKRYLRKDDRFERKAKARVTARVRLARAPLPDMRQWLGKQLKSKEATQ